MPSWKATLDLVRGGSEDSIHCGRFDCSPSERPQRRPQGAATTARLPGGGGGEAISRHMPIDIES